MLARLVRRRVKSLSNRPQISPYRPTAPDAPTAAATTEPATSAHYTIPLGPSLVTLIGYAHWGKFSRRRRRRRRRKRQMQPLPELGSTHGKNHKRIPSPIRQNKCTLHMEDRNLTTEGFFYLWQGSYANYACAPLVLLTNAAKSS
jgi:hypothetical protein